MIFKNDHNVRVQRNRVGLLDGDSLYLRDRPGTELRVHVDEHAPAGSRPALLWVTEEGCLDDVFLAPGQCHVVRGRGRVVATAWGALQVRVAGPGELAAEALETGGRPWFSTPPARPRSPATPAPACALP